VLLHWFHQGNQDLHALGFRVSVFVSRDVIFYDDLMLLAKSKTENKAQGEASDSSVDSQREEFEFSDDSNKSVGSDEDRQEATQEQHVQLRPLRWPNKVSIPPIKYDWEEDQISFALVTEAGDPSQCLK